MVAFILTSLGDALLSEGDLFNAITEYKRQLFRGEGNSETVLLKIGYAYYVRRKYDYAAYYFSLSRKQFPEALYLQAIALIKGNDSPTALYLVEGDTSSMGKWVRALALVSLGRYKKARTVLDSLGVYPPIRWNGRVYVALSYLLPGSGHMFLGRYSEGFKTLIANTIAFAGAYYLLKRKLYYDLILYVPTVLLRFYEGGVSRVKKHIAEDNTRVIDRIADSLVTDIMAPILPLSTR